MARQSAKRHSPAPEPTALRVLMVEHNDADVELCLAALRQAGYAPRADVVSTGAEFTARLEANAYDVIISDFRLPGWSGTDALAQLRRRDGEVPFILVTGTIGDEAAVDVIKQGATDYVLKDRIARLPMAVRRALEERSSRRARLGAEQALRASELRYRSLVDNATYGIYTATAEGRFLTANAALVQMLGYESYEELSARNIDREVYADPESRQRLVARFGEAERIQAVEVEWKRKDGSPITVRLSGRPVPDAQGNVAVFEMFAEDITARGMIEERLRQVQKMEAMGELTGGIAHDFNNLLTIITTNAELIEEELPPELSEVRAELSELKSAAIRGSAMIRKLLMFSRKNALEVELVEVNDVVRETANLLRRFLPETIELKLSLRDAPCPIMGDSSALEQVLINLATNARDAMPRGGLLEIALHQKHLDDAYLAGLGASVPPGEYLCLSVSDTGIGMDARTRSRMFEPFFTTKAPTQGTGLGMAMVYGLVKEHRGFINVYSEPGEGTAITLYLPLAGEGPVTTAAPVARARGGNETIMVVEDEEMIRSSARRILERYGYRVLLAADGEQALQILRLGQDQVDLIISDVVMPRLSGRQLLDALRRAGNLVPFIYTSGYNSLDARESGSLDPAVPLLPKPWAASDLAQLVRQTLDRTVRPA